MSVSGTPSELLQAPELYPARSREPNSRDERPTLHARLQAPPLARHGLRLRVAMNVGMNFEIGSFDSAGYRSS